MQVFTIVAQFVVHISNKYIVVGMSDSTNTRRNSATDTIRIIIQNTIGDKHLAAIIYTTPLKSAFFEFNSSL